MAVDLLALRKAMGLKTPEHALFGFPPREDGRQCYIDGNFCQPDTGKEKLG